MTPAKDSSLPFNAPYGSSQTTIPDSTWVPAPSGINPAELQARITAFRRSDWSLSHMDAQKMALEELRGFAAPQSGRPNTKAASRRDEAATKARKDAKAKARDEAAAEQAAAKAKAEAEANLRPPLPFVLPKISLTDCFRTTPN
jgi:hypothetical protein